MLLHFKATELKNLGIYFYEKVDKIEFMKKVNYNIERLITCGIDMGIDPTLLNGELTTSLMDFIEAYHNNAKQI